jgi:hypothetical protein
VLAELDRAIASSRYFSLLTDARGVVLAVGATADASVAAVHSIARPGVDLSEPSVGTTAIGAALGEMQPVWLHRGEHYFDATSVYSCAGAPIFGPDGQLAGMLDLTGVLVDERPELRHLASQMAQRIEAALLVALPRHRLLHVQWPGASGSDTAGLLAVDADGVVVGANADLHCHSTVSDGTLRAGALAARARAGNGVELWALTDHDEIGGQQRARARRAGLGLAYLTGTEISVTFAGETVHIVGLGFDPTTPSCASRPGRHARRPRRARARWPTAWRGSASSGAYEGALKYVGNPDLISRTHFARFLVERRRVRDTTRCSAASSPKASPASCRTAGPAWATRCAGSRRRRRGGDRAPGALPLHANEEYALFTEFKAPRRPGRRGGDRQPQRAERCVRRHRAGVRPVRLARQRLPFSPGESRTDLGPARPAGRLTPVWDALPSASTRAA